MKHFSSIKYEENTSLTETQIYIEQRMRAMHPLRKHIQNILLPDVMTSGYLRFAFVRKGTNNEELDRPYTVKSEQK